MRQVNPSPPYAKHPAGKIVLILIVGGMIGSMMIGGIQGWHEQSVFKQMSPAEHLREAKSNRNFPAIAIPHLAAIPASAPEYKEVPALMKIAHDVEEEDRLRHQRVEGEQAQEQRDSNALLSSYWPTTVRVDSDMDSFWLNGEERTCVTTPGANGRVAIVTCNYSSSHQTHNIPVKFWGSVDRNFVSDWRCRREGDEFVCRATD